MKTIVTSLLLLLPTFVAAQSAGGGQKVQPLTLGTPEAGHIEGSYARLAVSETALTMGSMQIPFPYGPDSERGGLLFSPLPSYSHQNGFSEWGRGWDNESCIYRHRDIGFINYEDDSYISPWGELEQASSGDFFPIDLASRIRVRRTGDNFTAFDSIGNIYLFGKSAKETTRDGTYRWCLDRVTSKEGDKSTFKYLKNNSGKLLLDYVIYGGRKQSQYILNFDYESFERAPTVSFKSGEKRELDRRVERVELYVRTDGTSSAPAFSEDADFSRRWHIELTYEYLDQSHIFYLTSLQKFYNGDESEPKISYDYHTQNEELKTANSKEFAGIGPALADLKTTGFFAKSAAFADVNDDGLLDIERGDTLELFLQNDDGEFIPQGAPNQDLMDEECNHKNDLPSRFFAKKRYLTRLAGPESEIVAVRFEQVKTDAERQKGKLLVCSLEGELIYTKTVNSYRQLAPDATTKFTDINADGKPDVVNFVGDELVIYENLSTKNDIKFSEKTTVSVSNQDFDRRDAYYFQDMNGDNIGDIVSNYGYGLRVAFGLGNLNFAKPVRMSATRGSRPLQTEGLDSNFIDINRDGLMDVIWIDGTRVFLFVNRGSDFKSINLDQGIGLARGLGVRVIDLTGSGNSQLVTYNGGERYKAVQLNKPEAGFLKKVDNGQGVSHSFEYERLAPKEGRRYRPVVLSEATVRSAGEGSKKVEYSFSKPKFSSINDRFLGFEYLKTKSSLSEVRLYSNVSEKRRTKTKKIKATDLKLGLDRVETFGYDSVSFEGLKFNLHDSTSLTYEKNNRTTTAIESRILSFDGICPEISQVTKPSRTLTQSFSYFSNSSWSDHPHCLSEKTSFQGKHDESSLDFFELIESQRNRFGQVEFLYVGRDRKLIQSVDYHPDSNRLQSVVEPSGKKDSFTFDDDYEYIKGTRSSDGSRASVNEYNTLLDRVKSVEMKRGNSDSTPFTETFGYDYLGRLTSKTNNLFNKPKKNQQFSYEYPTNSKPARLRIRSLTGAGEYAEVIELSTGTGRDAGTIEKSKSGYYIKNSTRHFVSTDTKRFAATGDRPRSTSSVTYDDQKDLTEISFQKFSKLGGLEEAEIDWEENETEKLNVSYSVASGRLQKKETTNGQFTEISLFDGERNKVASVDAESNTYRFKYDAMDRLREVTLPSGEKHTVSYNSYGEIEEIRRDGIGRINHSYYPDSRLLDTKTFINSSGRTDRSEKYEYDSTGRKSQTTYRKGSVTRKVSLFYDGKTAARPSLRTGEIGFLTGVGGERFQKEFTHYRNGQAKDFKLIIDGTAALEKSYAYHPNHSLERVDVSDGINGANYAISYIYNNLGQLDQIIAADSTLELAYDSIGRIESVTKGPSKYSFIYDAHTKARRGVSLKIGTESKSYRFKYDDRGYFETEDFNLQNQSKTRTYSYDQRGFLDLASSASENFSYSYDEDGMISSNSEPQAVNSVNLDSAGRIKSLNGKTIEYGPFGRIHSYGGSSTNEYDENGHLVVKEDVVGIKTVFADDIVQVDGRKTLQSVKVDGQLIGLIENGRFKFSFHDIRGTKLDSLGDQQHTPYGYSLEQEDLHYHFVNSNYQDDLGIYSMGVRSYSPKLGQFITPDPLFLEGPVLCVNAHFECNLYSYAKSNPLTYLDPTGTNALDQAAWAEFGNMMHYIKHQALSTYYSLTGATKQVGGSKVTGGGAVATGGFSLGMQNGNVSLRVGYNSGVNLKFSGSISIGRNQGIEHTGGLSKGQPFYAAGVSQSIKPFKVTTYGGNKQGGPQVLGKMSIDHPFGKVDIFDNGTSRVDLTLGKNVKALKIQGGGYLNLTPSNHGLIHSANTDFQKAVQHDNYSTFERYRSGF